MDQNSISLLPFREVAELPSGALASCAFYRAYSLGIKSSWKLPMHEAIECRTADVELLEDPFSGFTGALHELRPQSDDENWFHHLQLPDGSNYLRWRGLFEFLISADGRRINGRPLSPDGALERLRTYLLGQVLSFSLVRQGIEPFHATAVEIDGRAVAFLGDTGYGKSTLGAAFLQAGYRILTDDLLVIKQEDRGFLAYSGPPRIKLFPEIARVLLGDVTGITMNPGTAKLILPLTPQQYRQSALPIRSIYALKRPQANWQGTQVVISALSPREACIELIANMFNTAIRGPDRLAQQFKLATRVAAGIRVASLTYPRELSHLREVVESIRSDSSY